MAIYGNNSIVYDNTKLFNEADECISKLDSLLFIYKENNSEVIQELFNGIKKTIRGVSDTLYYTETIIIKLQEVFRKLKQIIANIIYKIKRSIYAFITKRSNNLKLNDKFVKPYLDNHYDDFAQNFYVITTNDFEYFLKDSLNYASDSDEKIQKEIDRLTGIVEIMDSSSDNNAYNKFSCTGLLSDNNKGRIDGNRIKDIMKSFADIVNAILSRMDFYQKTNDRFCHVVEGKLIHNIRHNTHDAGSRDFEKEENDTKTFKEFDKYKQYSVAIKKHIWICDHLSYDLVYAHNHNMKFLEHKQLLDN